MNVGNRLRILRTKHRMSQMVKKISYDEIVADNIDCFDFSLSLPVARFNYGGLMRWHSCYLEVNGSPLIRFVNKLWSPLFSLQDCCGADPKLMLFAYDIERPSVCIQLSDFEPQNPILATLMTLGCLGHCRSIQSKICFRLARSPTLQKANTRPSMAFLRAYSRIAPAVCSALAVFPERDMVAFSVLRFLSYVGVKFQICMIPFLTEDEFSEWFKKTSFKPTGALALEAPEFSELLKSVKRLATQYTTDAIDTTSLEGECTITSNPSNLVEHIDENAGEQSGPRVVTKYSDFFLFKIEEDNEEEACVRE
jgi:hypothetical protein